MTVKLFKNLVLTLSLKSHDFLPTYLPSFSGSCETYEQEKVVCHYHDCVRGTITKPDYRMVDEKPYFDSTMKHLAEEETKDSDKDGAQKQDGDEAEEKPKERKKSKAMVINHKIYF